MQRADCDLPTWPFKTPVLRVGRTIVGDGDET